MLIAQLTLSNFPVLNTTDKVVFALQLMEDYEVSHLPVVNNEKYSGLISKDDLLDADKQSTLHVLEDEVINVSVKQTDHLLTALKLAANYAVTILPVINDDKEILGIITQTELMRAANNFTGGEQDGAIIVLEMDRINFSFGQLSRLIETNDASITQLNTAYNAADNSLTVTIKINKTEVSDIIATLQRYNYNVLHYYGEEAYENQLKENYDLLMAYLKM